MDTLKGKQIMVWTFMGNTRMYQALRDYGDRLDTGGCVNTLTKYRPTPLGKGNGPAHSMIVEVTKA